MIKRTAFFLMIFTLFFIEAQTQDACRVDQEQLTTAGASAGCAGIGFEQAQRLVPGFTGILQSVDVGIANSDVDNTVTVEIQTIMSGVPSGVVLGSVTSGPLSVNAGPFMQTLDFSGLSLVLNKGVSYALVVKSPASDVGSVSLFFAIGTGGTAYQTTNNGLTWVTFAGDDQVYRTTMCENVSIPTLSEWGLIILGVSLSIFGLVSIRQGIYQLS